MNAKYNEATDNRPEGDRVIDASFLFIDIEKYHRQLTEEDAWQKNDRNGITLFKSGGHTIVLSALHEGAALPGNEIKGTVTIQVVEGFLTANLGAEDIDLRKGNMIILHANINHSLVAKDDSLILITTNML
jgi:quercetin dioxygenase-like cupin family protein